MTTRNKDTRQTNAIRPFTLKSVLAEIMPANPVARRRFLNASREYRCCGIDSVDAVAESYFELTRNAKFVALLIFRTCRFKRALPIASRELRSKDALISGMASVTLGEIIDRINVSQTIKMLKHAAIHSRSRGLRLNAISALSNVRHKPSLATVSGILTQIVRDSSDANARALACEGLVNSLYFISKKRVQYRNWIKILLNALNDRDPNVRGCAAYALGQLRVKKARNALKRLFSDKAEFQGIGTVSSEAKEACKFIDRKPGG